MSTKLSDKERLDLWQAFVIGNMAKNGHGAIYTDVVTVDRRAQATDHWLNVAWETAFALGMSEDMRDWSALRLEEQVCAIMPTREVQPCDV